MFSYLQIYLTQLDEYWSTFEAFVAKYSNNLQIWKWYLDWNYVFGFGTIQGFEIKSNIMNKKNSNDIKKSKTKT